MTSGSGVGGRLLASFPTDVRNGGGIGITKSGLATRIAIDLRNTQRLTTLPLGGLVPVQDPGTGLIGALPVSAMPTAQTGDGSQTNAKLATMPPRTFKANLLSTTAAPQDVNFAQVLEALGITSGGSVATNATNVSVVPPASQGYTNVQGAITSIEGRIPPALKLGDGALLNVGVPGGLVSYDDPRLGTGGGTPIPVGSDRTFHIDDFGGNPNGVADNVTALKNCWNACVAAGGGTVSLKRRGKAKYLFSGPVVLTFVPACGGISIEGSHQDACTLYFPNGGGLEIQFTANRNGCHASNFTCLTDAFGVGEGLCYKNIYYGAAGHSHICFNSISYVTCTGTQEAGQFRGCYWARGISMRGTTYVNIVGCITEGGSNGEFTVPFQPKGIGIAVAGSPISPDHNSNQTYGLIYNLKDCTMNCHDIGFLYDNFVQGVTIDATNIGYCRCAISTVSAANEYKGGTPAADGTTNEGSLLAQLYVTNSQVGANYGNVIEFLVAMFTASFVNCTFFIRRNCYGLYAPVYVPVRIDNCTFQGDAALIPANELRPDGVVAGTVGIFLGGAAVAGGTVHNCDFVALANGILLACSGCKFDGLDFKQCTIPIADNGNNNIFGALMYASQVQANLPQVTIPPKTAQPNSASRELQFESRRTNGTTVLGKLYLDTDGNLTLVSTENNGTPLSAAILNVLQQTLAAKDIRASGGLVVQGGASVANNLAAGSLNVGGAAAINQTTTNSLTVNGAGTVSGNLGVGGGFAVQGGSPVGKQSITGNITGDLNGVRNTVTSIVAALLAYNMVTNNTN